MRAQAALALRARVLARRHATPLDVLLAAGTVGLGWLAGSRLHGWDPALMASVGLAALGALGAAVARHQLYRSRELVLLLAQPISPRDLVLVRFAELTVTGLVLAAVLAAVTAGALGDASVPGTIAAALVAAPLLAGAQLLLAFLTRRLPGFLALVLPAAVFFGRFTPPGASFARLVAGEVDLLLPACAVLAPLLVLVLVPLGHQTAVDRLSVKPTRAPWLAVPRALVPLPRASAALVQRDLALIARGAFPRGALVLLGLPAGLLVFAAAAQDKTLEAWQGELAALMTGGALATVATYLFAIDFPRARVAKLVFERALPVRGGQILLARWFEAASPGVLLALAIGAIASSGKPAIAERAVESALSGVLLALMVAHHGACFGLETEAEGAAADVAVSAGYPFAAGTLVVVASIALTIHPALALLYPLTYGRLHGPATRAWERAELLASLGGGA
jgi:hypothetical protein